MYRFAQKNIEEWFFSKRRKPLVLRGARQVGKSTLVRLVAVSLNLDLIEINLERYLYLEDLFSTMDVAKILDEIQGLIRPIEDKSRAILFLDEIQAIPIALQSLRYFYEDCPDLAVISAGSLLEFTLSDHTFSMPVGRISYFHLGPISFSEFLYTVDRNLYDSCKNITLERIVPDSIHEKLLAKQREYLFVGGMPEAVSYWYESESIEEVQKIQREILDTYLDDFSKYARKGELARLQKIFRMIPGQIGKKIKYSNFSMEDKSALIKEAIELLCKARISFKIPYSDCSGMPLAAGIKDKVFKLIFIDIGLMNNLLGLRWIDIKNLSERALVNEGPLAEQFVGQELLTRESFHSTPELYYWIREGKASNAEVDYIVAKGTEIIPVEVKSGSEGSMKSLHQFIYFKKSLKAIRFDLNKPSVQKVHVKVPNSSVNNNSVSFELVSLPLYLAGRILKYI